MIYLDNSATTYIDPRVLKTMMPYLKENMAILPVFIIRVKRRAMR